MGIAVYFSLIFESVACRNASAALLEDCIIAGAFGGLFGSVVRFDWRLIHTQLIRL